MNDLLARSTACFTALAEIHTLMAPFACTVIVIVVVGRTVEGRDIWLLTITEKATGAHCDKPAFWYVH